MKTQTSRIGRIGTDRSTPAVALVLAVALLGTACATATPVELQNARIAYNRASAGPAAQLTPADLHKAKTALDEAEQTFQYGNDLQKTIDLAYIAERTAQIAEARAQGVISEKKAATATQDLGNKQTEMVKTSQGALTKSREELAESQRGQATLAGQAAASDQKAAASDQKAAASEQRAAASDLKASQSEQKAIDANDALAKLAAKEEERGTIITLSGSVLFRSNDSALLPASLARLDQVAEALVAKGNHVTVEGYTDSRGSQATNMNLSQRRAESVRSYLVTRGFPMEKIEARGMGPDRPIADNASAEGRANNRRVEIVIAKSSPQDRLR
jgi:outer membrane protein OmpA-like peptidoglycan-associated protein